MKIKKARHMGQCFGVKDAIALAKDSSRSQSLTILGQLVHNPTVNRDLQRRGIHFAERQSNAATSAVMITAHGTSNRHLSRLKDQGFNIVEGTCPLVRYAHHQVLALEKAGYHPVIIGKPNHVEVRGLAEDLLDCDIIENEADLRRLKASPRFGVIAQTTQPIDQVKKLVERLRIRFPSSEVMFRDTVCRPTKERQQAAIEIAKASSIVIVVGGINSNNTHQLLQTCLQECPRVHQIEDESGLVKEWFKSDDTVGITAGTSTPDVTIRRVENALSKMTL